MPAPVAPAAMTSAPTATQSQGLVAGARPTGVVEESEGSLEVSCGRPEGVMLQRSIFSFLCAIGQARRSLTASPTRSPGL